MAGPSAPEQGIPTKETSNNVVQFKHKDDARFRDQVAKEAGKVDRSFLPEHAIPASEQPVHNKSISHIRPGINTEPLIDAEDFADRTEKLAQGFFEPISDNQGILHRVETASNIKAQPGSAVLERSSKKAA